MPRTRTWNDGSSRARLNVPSGKGASILIAHVGSRSGGLLHGAGLVFVGKKIRGDYHGEMCSDIGMKWLENQVLPKIRGGVLVVNRALYHFVLTDDTRLANRSMRKAVFSDSLAAHQAVWEDWAGVDLRQGRTRAQTLVAARQKLPTPRCLAQDMARQFDVAILSSPVAQQEPNPIEMVWATIKGALRPEYVDLSMSRLQELVDQEFKHITAEAWCRYEDHAINMEDYYRGLQEVAAQIEEELDAGEIKEGDWSFRGSDESEEGSDDESEWDEKEDSD